MQTFPCRWAIVGTGEVAGKFALGLRSVPGAEASLVVSRSAERAAALAARLGVKHSVGGYENALDHPIDAVYIATPPSEHRANALLFIAAGKPVLIEKPFAASLSDAQAIVAAAQSAGVFCMEGMWTRFLPALQLARTLIAEGRIGAPRSLSASFAVAQMVDPANSLFNAGLGGGATGHRGVYPISLAVDLLGPAVLDSAVVIRGETSVDEEATATLHHANGAVSTLYAGTRTTADNSLTLLGTEGNLRFAGPIFRPYGVQLEAVRPRSRGAARWGRAAILKEGPLAQGLRQRLGGLTDLLAPRRLLRAPYIGNGYAHEAMAVMHALAEGWTQHPLMPHEATLAIAGLVDEIRAIGARP